MPTITLIGAGSAVFSLNLIRDLCLTPNLAGSRVIFMDIDESRLNAVHRLCQRLAEEVGIDLELVKTSDRRAALQGADFVINTALGAGHDRLQAGWQIGREHGYRIGGSLHIMHDEAFWINFYQYRLFETFVEDILEICPQAYYIQVANPVFAGISYLGRRYPAAKIVGLCHGYNGVYYLADKLGLDTSRLSYELPGVNHFIFLNELYEQGRDAMPEIAPWIARGGPNHWREAGSSDGVGPKPADLYRRVGGFPIGDTPHPGGGSWPYWYHTSDEVEAAWNEDPWGWYQRYFRDNERKVAEIARISADESVRVSDHFQPIKSSEKFIDLIESIACDIERSLIVNIPNQGEYIPGIPKDVAVEVQALISRRGIQGIRSKGLTRPILAHTYHSRLGPMEMELAAYESGSRDLLLQLILMDPYTKSLAQAEALLEDILAMPGNEAMLSHYR